MTIDPSSNISSFSNFVVLHTLVRRNTFDTIDTVKESCIASRAEPYVTEKTVPDKAARGNAPSCTKCLTAKVAKTAINIAAKGFMILILRHIFASKDRREKIWNTSTDNSARRIPNDVPEAPNAGIKKRFTTKATTAPAIWEYMTFFSCPVGTRICKPVTLLSPTNNSTGIIRRIGTTASAY